MPLALPWLVISTFITCSSPPSLPVCHNTSLHFNLITFLLFHLFSWPTNNFFFNSQVWLLAGARTCPSLHPFSTKNIYVHMAKKARKEIWKQISKWAMRQELEKESEKAQSAEGRRESEVGSGRNGVLLSPTARRDKLSGAFLYVCVCARTNIGRNCIELQEISAGLNATRPRRVCFCIRWFVCKRLLKRVVTPCETSALPLFLTVASICVKRYTLKVLIWSGRGVGGIHQ